MTAGLNFPGADHGFKPDCNDFVDSSFTIAVASQTADVSISSRALRRLALLQSVPSFVFNTAMLAFTIALAVGIFSALGHLYARNPPRLRLPGRHADPRP